MQVSDQVEFMSLRIAGDKDDLVAAQLEASGGLTPQWLKGLELGPKVCWLIPEIGDNGDRSDADAAEIVSVLLCHSPRHG